MIGDSTEDFLEKVKGFILSFGVDKETIESFDSILKLHPNIKLLIKMDFSEDEDFDFSLYWQNLAKGSMINKIFNILNITGDSLCQIKEYSLLLRNQVLFPGLSFSQPNKLDLRVFYANRLDKSKSFLISGISAIMAKMGFDAHTINLFISLHNYLSSKAKGSLFTSFAFKKCSLDKGIKLDYEIIPLKFVIEIMRVLSIPKSQEERLINTLSILEMERLTYLGIRFLPLEKPMLKFYFDRRFSKKNENYKENLADLIQDTIWIP